MEIDFIKSSTNKIDRYVKLYRRCFAKYPIKKNEIYFEWLYKKNPLGEFIGIDAVDLNSGEEIGQVGGVPYEFNYNGKKIKVLQSINVCVDRRYRGKKLFKEMASRLEEYAKSENYSLIIAIRDEIEPELPLILDGFLGRVSNDQRIILRNFLLKQHNVLQIYLV